MAPLTKCCPGRRSQAPVAAALQPAQRVDGPRHRVQLVEDDRGPADRGELLDVALHRGLA